MSFLHILQGRVKNGTVLSTPDPLPQGLRTFRSTLCSLHLPSNILITCQFPRKALLTRTDGDGLPGTSSQCI